MTRLKRGGRGAGGDKKATGGKDNQLSCHCSSKAVPGNKVTDPPPPPLGKRSLIGVSRNGHAKTAVSRAAGWEDVVCWKARRVLTWLFGWLNQLRVQVRAVLRIYSALVLLPTSTYSVKTHSCGQRQALTYC